MFRFIAFCLLLVPLTAFAAGSGTQPVAHVLSGNSFVLASGDVVRLASIEVPDIEEKADDVHSARLGEPLGDEARIVLGKLLAGHTVRLDTTLKRDRHNRLLGQVYDEKGNWIQGEMLKAGFAMVHSFSDDKHDMIEKMLGLEHEAQIARRGIWAEPYFRIIAPQEAQQFMGRFKLVEGKVVSVHDYHGHTYINFSGHWKGNFSVFISRKHVAAFAGMSLPSLAGKTIRVRGWIDYHNAPTLDLTHPEQIEVE